MKQMDMHMHSYYSDGSLDLLQLAGEIKEKNLSLCALTDHDCIDGVDEMAKILKGMAIDFIRGVEISSTFEGMEFHLLVYRFDAQNSDFLDLLAANIKIRLAFDQALIKALVDRQIQGVCLEAFNAFEDQPYDGGWPSINYLKSLGLVKDFSDYLDLVEGVNKMVFPSPDKVIEVAHACGAKVILAHPSSNQKGGLSQRILDTFVGYGIDGIECYSPYHTSDEEVNTYKDYCRQKGLVVSGGSDYHGGYTSRGLGQQMVMDHMADYDFFMDLSKCE